MKNKQNKTWLITYVVVALILVAGVVLFISQIQKEEESFPELSLAPGSTFKGMFTDPAKYLQYEEGDTCEHDTNLTSNTLQQGRHLYYATEDLTFQDVVDRINCVPFNRVRILYLDSETGTFYSYPEEYYQNTTTVSDPSAVTIKALHGFIIESSKETLIGGVYSETEAAPHEMAPHTNIFNEGNLYGFLHDIESGWALIPGVANGPYLIGYLNSSDLIDRVEKVYVQTGEYDFAEVTKTNGAFEDISYDNGYYMIWMKLVVPPLVQAIVEMEIIPVIPTIQVENECGGADADHACVTDASSPATFIQTGDDACAPQDCLRLEISFHNQQGGDPVWEPATDDCDAGDADLTYAGAYRATCGEWQGNLCDQSDEDSNNLCVTTTGNATCQSEGKSCAYVEFKNENTPNSAYVQLIEGCDNTVEELYDSISNDNDLNLRAFCSPCSFGDDTYACVTGDRDTQTSHGMMSENIFYTGQDACDSINKSCIKVESSADGNGPWTELVTSPHTTCYDRLPDAAYDGIIQGYIINGSAYYPYVIRAECQ